MSSSLTPIVLAVWLVFIVYVQSVEIEVFHCGLYNESNIDISSVSKVLDGLEYSEGLSTSTVRDAAGYDVSSLFSDTKAFSYVQAVDIASNIVDAVPNLMEDISHLNR